MRRAVCSTREQLPIMWNSMLCSSVFIVLAGCAEGLAGFTSFGFDATPALHREAHQIYAADDAPVTDLETRVSRTAKVAAYLAEDAVVLSRELQGLQEALQGQTPSALALVQSHQVDEKLRTLGMQIPATFQQLLPSELYHAASTLGGPNQPALLAEAATEKLTGAAASLSLAGQPAGPPAGQPAGQPAGAAPPAAAGSGAPAAGPPPPAGPPTTTPAPATGTAAPAATAQADQGTKCGGPGQFACSPLMSLISFNYKFGITVSVVLWVLIFVAVMLLLGGCIGCALRRPR